MSGEQRGSNVEEPESKRQKRGGEEAAPEIIAFGGPMYDEATARKMLKEVVLISEEAQGELELEDADLHFDPDRLDILYYVDDEEYGGEQMTAMTYFARKGDAKMCRYLISRGASTTKMDDEDAHPPSFPMHEAADEGHLEICKLLYANGAQSHVRSGYGRGWTPFHVAANKDRDQVLRWLTLHGALCADGSSEAVKGERIYPMVYRGDEDWMHQGRNKIYSSCQRLIEWAKEVTQTHSSLVAFLHGALPPAPDQGQSRTLQCLSGHPGVRKHIGDYVGLEVTKRKQLRILHQVVGVLPSFID